MAYDRQTEVVSVKAGCNGCATIWTAKNAFALAAQHHEATRHVTWAEQTLKTTYGGAGVKQSKEPTLL